MLALPASEVSDLQGLMQAITEDGRAHWMAGSDSVAAFLIALSNLGAAGAYLAAVARLPFVAGLDRYIAPVLGALHPRWRTPWVALLVQAAFGDLIRLSTSRRAPT